MKKIKIFLFFLFCCIIRTLIHPELNYQMPGPKKILKIVPIFILIILHFGYLDGYTVV